VICKKTGTIHFTHFKTFLKILNKSVQGSKFPIKGQNPYKWEYC